MAIHNTLSFVVRSKAFSKILPTISISLLGGLLPFFFCPSCLQYFQLESKSSSSLYTLCPRNFIWLLRDISISIFIFFSIFLKTSSWLSVQSNVFSVTFFVEPHFLCFKSLLHQNSHRIRCPVLQLSILSLLLNGNFLFFFFFYYFD